MEALTGVTEVEVPRFAMRALQSEFTRGTTGRLAPHRFYYCGRIAWHRFYFARLADCQLQLAKEFGARETQIRVALHPLL